MSYLNPEDKVLLAALKDPQQYVKALEGLYKNAFWRQSVRHFIETNNGTEKDFLEVFQDAMIDFSANIKNGKFEEKAALHTYFMAIAKNKWFTKLKQRLTLMSYETLDNIVENTESTEQAFEQQEIYDILDTILKKIGAPCQTILTMYMEKYSYKEIAEILNLTSINAVKTQCYECRLKVRKYIEERPELLKILRGGK